MNPPQLDAALARANAKLDQEWAEVREMAMEADPRQLWDLYLKLDPDRSLAGLSGEERPFVAALARMAIKQVFSMCAATEPDPE